MQISSETSELEIHFFSGRLLPSSSRLYSLPSRQLVESPKPLQSHAQHQQQPQAESQTVQLVAVVLGSKRAKFPLKRIASLLAGVAVYAVICAGRHSHFRRRQWRRCCRRHRLCKLLSAGRVDPVRPVLSRLEQTRQFEILWLSPSVTGYGYGDGNGNVNGLIHTAATLAFVFVQLYRSSNQPAGFTQTQANQIEDYSKRPTILCPLLQVAPKPNCFLVALEMQRPIIGSLQWSQIAPQQRQGQQSPSCWLV